MKIWIFDVFNISVLLRKVCQATVPFTSLSWSLKFGWNECSVYCVLKYKFFLSMFLSLCRSLLHCKVFTVKHFTAQTSSWATNLRTVTMNSGEIILPASNCTFLTERVQCVCHNDCQNTEEIQSLILKLCTCLWTGTHLYSASACVQQRNIFNFLNETLI